MYRKQNNDVVSNLLSEHISNKQTNKIKWETDAVL